MDAGLSSCSYSVPELLTSSRSQTVLPKEDLKQIDKERIQRVEAEKEEWEKKEQMYVEKIEQLQEALMKAQDETKVEQRRWETEWRKQELAVARFQDEVKTEWRKQELVVVRFQDEAKTEWQRP